MSFLVEEDNAAVVQVESDARPCVALHLVPVVPITVDALYHHDGLLVHLIIYITHCAPIVPLHRQSPQFQAFHLIHEARLLASRLPKRLILVMLHRRGLTPVGQSEIEPSQFPCRCIQHRRIQLPVGIIWPVLVHHIADKRIVSGRLDAETTTVENAAEPYDATSNAIHFAS